MKSCIDKVLLATIFSEEKKLNFIEGHNGGNTFIVEYSRFQSKSVPFMSSLILD